MVQELFRQDDYVICAPAPTPRTSDPKKMAELIPCRADAVSTLEEGLDKAFAALEGDAVLCVVGSLYIQGPVRQYLRHTFGLFPDWFFLSIDPPTHIYEKHTQDRAVEPTLSCFLQ